MFTITHISLRPCQQIGSLIGFCDIELENSLKLNNVGIHLLRNSQFNITPACRKLKNGVLIPYFDFSQELKTQILETVKKEIDRLNLFGASIEPKS